MNRETVYDILIVVLVLNFHIALRLCILGQISVSNRIQTDSNQKSRTPKMLAGITKAH